MYYMTVETKKNAHGIEHVAGQQLEYIKNYKEVVERLTSNWLEGEYSVRIFEGSNVVLEVEMFKEEGNYRYRVKSSTTRLPIEESYEELIEKILEWADDRGLLKMENKHKQYMKFIEEAGELAKAILENNKKEIMDGIGDIFVTLFILTEQLGYGIKRCIYEAYEEIKDRKGRTENGIFIKEK